MTEGLEGNEEVGVEVELKKDAYLYQKHENGKDVFRSGFSLPGGMRISVGGAEQMESLFYDHRKHEFTPVLSELESEDGEDKQEVYYLRTADLPQNF